jgi:hypothetical protein
MDCPPSQLIFRTKTGWDIALRKTSDDFQEQSSVKLELRVQAGFNNNV